MHNSASCPFCGCGLVNKHNFPKFVYSCLSCGLLIKSNLKPNGEYAELYKNAWLDANANQDKTGGTNIRLARIYAQKIANSLGLKSLAGLKVLDFGAGKGDMLRALSDLGAIAYGVEPFGYDYLKAKGFNVFRNLEDIPKGFLFDGIITIDVIEHLFSPWDTMRKLYGRLIDGGWLCVTTPNADCLKSRLIKTSWGEFHNPSHIYFLTPKSMRSIFNKLGFRKVKRLRWFVRYSGNPLLSSCHTLLQASGLDGEIRYLISKA